MRTGPVGNVLATECRRLAEVADRTYRRDITTPLYLAGKKDAAGVWRVVQVLPAEDADGVWVDPITPEPVPRSMTVDQLQGWFEERLRREPLGIIADMV